MALNQCAECKKEISSSASECPHCGFKVRSSGMGYGCAILLAVIAIPFFISLMSSSNADKNGTSDSTQTDIETLRKGEAEFAAALQDPQKVAVIECMGIKVYKDPQPPGHPASAEQCSYIAHQMEEKCMMEGTLSPDECAKIGRGEGFPSLHGQSADTEVAQDAPPPAASVSEPAPDSSSADPQPNSAPEMAPALALVPLIPQQPLAAQTEDVMASRFGNTEIVTNFRTEWHFYFDSGGTFSGTEMRSQYHTVGTWSLDKGNLCLRFQPQLPRNPYADCRPLTSHNVGDTWTSNGSTITLVQGIQ